MYDHNSLNKVMLIGRLGADPEQRYTQSDRAVTNFRMATNERWKDSNGERQERTEWHRVVTFGRTAEFCSNYLKRGKRVYIEGRLRTSTYEKNGETRYSTEIIAQNIQLLDGGGAQEGNNDQGYANSPSGGFNKSSGGEKGGYGGGGEKSGYGGGERGGYGGGGSPKKSSGDFSPPPPDDDDIPF